jgi:hypothetical protein
MPGIGLEICTGVPMPTKEGGLLEQEGGGVLTQEGRERENCDAEEGQ